MSLIIKKVPYSRRCTKKSQSKGNPSAFYNDDRVDLADGANFKLIGEDRNIIFQMDSASESSKVKKLTDVAQNAIHNLLDFLHPKAVTMGSNMNQNTASEDVMSAEELRQQKKLQKEAFKAEMARRKAEKKLLDRSLKIMEKKLLYAALMLEKVKRDLEAKRLSIAKARLQNQKTLEASKHAMLKAKEENLMLRMQQTDRVIDEVEDVATESESSIFSGSERLRAMREKLAKEKLEREAAAARLQEERERLALQRQQEEQQRQVKRLEELHQKEEAKRLAEEKKLEEKALKEQQKREAQLKHEQLLAEKLKAQEEMRAKQKAGEKNQAKATKSIESKDEAKVNKKSETDEDLNSMFDDLVKTHKNDKQQEDKKAEAPAEKQPPEDNRTTEKNKAEEAKPEESQSFADKYKSNSANNEAAEAKPAAPLDLEKIKEENEKQKALQMIRTKNRAFIVFLIKGEDRGRKAWYYLKIDKLKKNIFMKAAQSESINLDDYGEVIYSAYGEEPPEDIQKKVHDEYEDVY